MARPSFILRIQSFADKIGKKLDPFFPVRVFALSLAALMLILVISLGIMIALYAKVEVPAKPTGKVMATLTLEPEEDQIQLPPVSTSSPSPTSTPEEPPKTTTAHNLQTEDKPPEHIVIEDSIAGLSEDSDFGPLPIIRSSDNLTSLQAYKAPFTLKPDTKGVIAVVMVDFGLSEKLSRMAVDNLPAGMTYVASSYVDNLQSKIVAARTKGAEIWMHLPMQGKGNFAENDAGPAAILSGLNSKQNTDRLYKNLGRVTGYAGVALTVAPDYEPQSPDLENIIKAIKDRGLAIAQLDPQDMVIKSATAMQNAPFVQSSGWADATTTQESLMNALKSAENMALSRGYTVVAVHPSLQTITLLTNWSKSLPPKTLQLAPLSYALHQNAMTINAHNTPPSSQPLETHKK